MATVSSRAQILIVMGVSGSGKTTVGKALASTLGWSFIEGDRFHPDENIEKMAGGIPLTDSDRASWLEVLRKQIEICLQQDKSAVLACSALKASYRSVLQLDERVQFVFLNVPFEVARQRMTARQGHFMPVALLESQYKTLQQPEGSDFINVDAQQAPDQIVKEVVAKIRN